MAIFAINSDRYLSVVRDGIALWAAVVLPSLFPFFFLTALLSGLGVTATLTAKLSPLTRRAFRTSGVTAYAFFLSAVSGYPIGAKVIATLSTDKRLSADEATRAACFCTTVSPMFAIGSIGTCLLENKRVGMILYLSHIVATLLTGVFFRFYGKGEIDARPFSPPKADELLSDAMASSVASVLAVGGFIAFFYTLVAILHDFRVLEPIVNFLTLPLGDRTLAKGFLYGLLECTTGCKVLASANSAYVPSLIGFLISFGGVSVFCQNLVFLKKAKVKTTVYLASKAVQAILSSLFIFLCTAL